MRKREQSAVPAVGGSSLLVIFAVLCLTVFALLGLSAVQAYGRLSEASVQAVSDYYAADCAAEEVFARLRSGERPAEVAQNENHYAYACRISETQVLEVELLREEDRWTVLRWQAVSVAEMDEEQTLTVWDGETIS